MVLLAGRPRLAQVLAVAVTLGLALQFLASTPVGGASTPSLPTAPTIHGFRSTGAASDGLPVIATLALPLRNLVLLDSLVKQVSDPASPMYRHFQTPQQVGAEFLPVGAFESLLSYVNGTGLRVLFTALDSEIVVEGTAGQLRSAFGAEIDTYTNGTFSYYATSGKSTFDGALLYASNATFLYERPAVLTPPRPNSNVTFTSSSFSAKMLQPVYNATSLYSQGYTGAGQTIGLLDYYGSPTVSSDLRLFDSTFGFPDTKLHIIPVGPYDPNLGANVGWSSEISLDVESAHAMAPGAAIDMYVANGAVPLSAAIAQIVQDDEVTTLSQSFGTPEWYYSLTSYLGGPDYFTFNALLPDQYYALGSLEGITFLASSGDGGGSGYSSGPEGDLEYPATSPFVTSVGGTQTYFSATSSGGLSYVQTAWSNIGFVPNLSNEGGGGGGVSILEPKPWYQSQQAGPPTFPDGRLNPDLSLQAGVDPATSIVDAGSVVGIGGTSESSPLLAGLVALMAQSAGGSLGLINPFLYKVGDDPSMYAKGFEPITFGYTIPWKASSGYNLVAGLGAPNIGELSGLLNSIAPQRELNITGEIFEVGLNQTSLLLPEFTQGETLDVSALIEDGGARVTQGTFALSLQTLRGESAPAQMKYDPKTGNWTGSITIGDQSGMAYLYLNGTSSSGVSGQAVGTLFTGYLGSITVAGSIYTLPVDPWSWDSQNTLDLTVYTTDLMGNPAPGTQSTLAVEQYSIRSNAYTNSSLVTLIGTGSGEVDGSLSTPAAPGPVSLVMEGDVYGYAPTVYGIYLQSSYIYPEVAAEPGSVAPGQFLTIIANPIAPVNVYFETSYETGRTFANDVYYGSNVTASLVDSSGRTLSSSDLAYQPCAQALNVCAGGASMIYGQLEVPPGTHSGLYTVMLRASYGSYTPGGNLTGSFYGQVWVSEGVVRPSIDVLPGPGYVGAQAPCGSCSGTGGGAALYEGEQAHIEARLAYSNGTSIRYGEYTATLYPDSLSGSYASLMHTQYAGGRLVGLAYSAASGLWVGNITLPGPGSQGSLGGLNVNSFDYSGPYDVFVTGLSADGSPTDSTLGAQQAFYIQPYVYQTGQVKALASRSQIAFSGATISLTGNLTGDVFIGLNTVEGTTLRIESSQVRGTLSLHNSNVTMVGVSGGDLVVDGSNLVLKDSSVGSLVISGGRVTLVDSSYATVTPGLPVIQVAGLSGTIGGVASYNATVSGQGLTPSSLEAWVDGTQVGLQTSSTGEGLFATGTVNATALIDGVHSLTMTASQSDGLSSTLALSFSTNAHELSLEKSLESRTSALYSMVDILAIFLALALVIGVAALWRRRSGLSNPASAPHV